MADNEEAIAEAGGLGGLKEKILPLIKKFLPLIAVLVIAVVGYLVYSSLPQPATLSLTLKGLDENESISGAAVTLTDSSGNTYDGIAEDTTVFFDAPLPSNTELSVSVDAGSKYSSTPTESSITLEPGENSKTLFLPLNYKLKAMPSTLSVDLGGGCTKQLSVSVANEGRNAAETTLIADGDLKTMFGGAATKTIAAGGTAAFEFNLTAPLSPGTTSKQKTEKKSGSLRLKYTQEKVSVTVNVGAAPDLDLSPKDISLNQDDKRWIKVKNGGDVPVTDLRVEVEADAGMSVVVQNLVQTIPAKGETNFAVDVSAGAPGRYFAKIRVSDGGCNPKELTISLTKR